MPRAALNDTTPASEFLLACNRIRLSQLIRDPFVADAFRRAEDDGDFPYLTAGNNPPRLTGGAAEPTFSTRRVLDLVEG